jgi:hypothetical protein
VSQARVILYHKQNTSARTRFMRFAHGGVCGPEPLPPLAQLLEHKSDSKLLTHPAALINDMHKLLELAEGELEVDSEFQAKVDIASGPIQVFLVRFTTIDPPFANAEAQNAEFIDLPDARGMAPAELELLRKAYECIMEG